VSGHPRHGGYTYLLTVREDREPYVVSTIRTYYGALLSSVPVAPDGADGVLLLETEHELPSAAFERISETGAVVPLDETADDGGPEGVVALCATLAGSVPEGDRPAVRVHVYDRAGDVPDDTHRIHEHCLEGLREAGIAPAPESSECAVDVHVVGDWAGVRVESNSPA